MGITHEGLTRISTSLQPCSDFAQFALDDDLSVVIISPLERIQRVVFAAIDDLIRCCFHCDIHWDTKESDRKLLLPTILYFEKMFGKDRLHQAALAADINFEQMLREGSLLSKRQLRSLYLRLSFVTAQDLKELLDEIHSSNNEVRVLSQSNLQEMREHFFEKNQLDDCSNEDIELLYQIALPFTSPDDLFLKLDALAESSFEFVFTTEHMLKNVSRTIQLFRSKKLIKEPWEAIFGKRLGQAQFPKDIVVPHPEGYLHFADTIEDQGITKLLFQPLGITALYPHFLYRGTRGQMPSDTFQQAIDSIREDLTDELGAYGPMLTYRTTLQVIRKLSQVCFIGYSLGGAHAQRDAVLFGDYARRVVTVSSPGIDAKTTELFATIINKNAYATRSIPEIVHISEPDDIVDSTEEKHLGAGCERNCSIKALSYIPKTHPTAFRQLPIVKTPSSLFRHGPLAIVSDIINIFLAHTRTTPLFDHYCLEISNSENQQSLLQDILSHHPNICDQTWEKLRKLMCVRIAKPSFSSFALEVLTDRGIQVR